MAGFNLDNYVPVHERIKKFYKQYPEGYIKTELIYNEQDRIVIKAYAHTTEERYCTGHAEEVRGEGYINKTNPMENCETSAIGRALANMGFEIDNGIASLEEVKGAKERMVELEKKGEEKPVDMKKCDECGEEVNAKVYQYSIDKFNKVLCYNCQKKQ